ncbi:MAG: ABC transporter ATP-binding protein [Bacteroidota bacterium]
MSVPLIKTQGLGKTYPPANTILQGLDLEIQPGSYTVLMGRSGAGKSSLLNILMGLEPLSAGQLWYESRPMQGLNEKQWALYRRHNIGIVFQDHNLIPYLSLLENTVLAGLLNQRSQSEVRSRALSLFAELSIEPLADRLPAEVSGGERQRAAIARALINEPSILFADEPTGNLNDEASQAVLQVFAQLHQAGQSIILATHDVKSALEGTEVCFLRDGKNLTRWHKPAGSIEAQSALLYQWLHEQGW